MTPAEPRPRRGEGGGGKPLPRLGCLGVLGGSVVHKERKFGGCTMNIKEVEWVALGRVAESMLI